MSVRRRGFDVKSRGVGVAGDRSGRELDPFSSFLLLLTQDFVGDSCG